MLPASSVKRETFTHGQAWFAIMNPSAKDRVMSKERHSNPSRQGDQHGKHLFCFSFFLLSRTRRTFCSAGAWIQFWA